MRGACFEVENTSLTWKALMIEYKIEASGVTEIQ